MGSEQDKTGPAGGSEGPIRDTLLYSKQVAVHPPRFPRLLGGAGEARELEGNEQRHRNLEGRGGDLHRLMSVQEVHKYT